MTDTTHLHCICGQVHLEVERAPIVSAECCCNSCRAAAARLQALPDDVPNGRHQTLSFFAKLLGAWIAMGFRSPTMADNGELHVRQN